MMMKQFQEELNDMLQKDFPELLLEVYGDRGCPTIALGMGYINISFPIDRIEWIKNDTKKKKQRLVRLRLLDSLLKLNKLIHKAMRKCGGTV